MPISLGTLVIGIQDLYTSKYKYTIMVEINCLDLVEQLQLNFLLISMVPCDAVTVANGEQA